MARRRRPSREPAYSADSFLDIICNLVYKYVGIVLIILVLVAKQASLWPDLMPAVPEEAAAAPAPAAPPEGPRAVALAPEPEEEPEPEPPPPAAPTPAVAATADPVAQQYERELADLQKRLLAQVRGLDASRDRLRREQAGKAAVEKRQAEVKQQLADLDRQWQAVQAELAAQGGRDQPLRERLAALQKAVKEIEALPPERKGLRYHLPISRPADSGEVYFECRNGRVTCIYLQELLDLVKRKAQSGQAQELRKQWSVEDQVGPVGPYALRYQLIRQRSSALDDPAVAAAPVDDRSFAYHTSFEVVPVTQERGEALAQALAEGSAFRAVVGSLKPDSAVLTFFVYADSFPTFRVLRDYLAEHGYQVAGRPLRMTDPIAGGPRGTRTRAQ
jgi:hypothetical protein